MKLEGGCQCARIRYSVEIDDFEAYLCHCRMCQRATGGVSIAFKNVDKAKLSWSRVPEYYSSSPIARRPFCRECGTPLGFEYPDHTQCDLTVGSFDDPHHFIPVAHFGVESMHEAWIDTSTLPRERADEYEKLITRWRDAGLDIP
ncbi:MAG: GFA family protein [Sphingorhabdus sp.]